MGDSMDEDLKKIIKLTEEALSITKKRAKSEYQKLKKKGLNKEQIANVSKKVAVHAYKEGKRLKIVYQRELENAMNRLEKVAMAEARVIARRVNDIRKK